MVRGDGKRNERVQLSQAEEQERDPSTIKTSYIGKSARNPRGIVVVGVEWRGHAHGGFIVLIQLIGLE